MNPTDPIASLPRRQLSLALASAFGAFGIAFAPQARAISLSDLSKADATAGLKGALSESSISAVKLLGVENGFMNNAKVRIPLPGYLEKAAKTMKMLGMKKQVDELELAMNRAAEAAVPEAQTLLVDAVKTMSVTDAKNILTGGQTAGTEYFKGKTKTPLQGKFLPIVKKATEKSQRLSSVSLRVEFVSGLLVVKNHH